MTQEERNDYDKLSKEGRKFYDLYQGMHPEWPHGHLMTMVSVCCEDPFTPGGKKTLKEILYECIRKADAFMAQNFPNLYPAVKNVFSSIGNAINKAITVTWDFFVSLFSKF